MNVGILYPYNGGCSILLDSLYSYKLSLCRDSHKHTYLMGNCVCVLGWVHNMMLMVALHCVCHEGDAGIEFLFQRRKHSTSSIQSIRLSKFLALRIALVLLLWSVGLGKLICIRNSCDSGSKSQLFLVF